MEANNFAARGNGVFEISGRLTFQSVPDFLVHTARWLNDTNGPVTIDLSKVTLADSAGLALMLEWLQQARVVKRELKFINFSTQIQHLISVSGLDHVFGLS